MNNPNNPELVKHWRCMLPIIQAYVDGKQIQYKTAKGWANESGIDFSNLPGNYRIFEPPKLRPFEFSEVPLGAWYRLKGSSRFCAIVAGNAVDGKVEFKDGVWTLQGLFSDWEYSIDDGKTWLPCGIKA